jgi:cephalosporin hydroxylase
MKTLQEIFNGIGNLTPVDGGHNDKGGQIHTYLETYDKLFKPFQNGCTFMEIGLAMGKSIELFDEYFENSKIYGVDLSIVFEPLKYKNDVHLIASDGTKPEFLHMINDKFDIVIDDGSHMTQDQIDTFNLVKPYMKAGGVYIIEDILALDSQKHLFKAIHDNCEIIDMRSNGRFDNVLLVYRF